MHNIELYLDQAMTHLCRGVVLLNLNREEEAIADYDRAIHLYPASAKAHYNRGTALQKLIHPEQAVSSYQRALTLEPFYAKACFLLCVMTHRLYSLLRLFL
jgi:tetratricopeptide (TPR) repeat protein